MGVVILRGFVYWKHLEWMIGGPMTSETTMDRNHGSRALEPQISTSWENGFG